MCFCATESNTNNVWVPKLFWKYAIQAFYHTLASAGVIKICIRTALFTNQSSRQIEEAIHVTVGPNTN